MIPAAQVNASDEKQARFSCVINSGPYWSHKAFMCLYFHLLVNSYSVSCADQLFYPELLGLYYHDECNLQLGTYL